jgi:hypothetical protein
VLAPTTQDRASLRLTLLNERAGTDCYLAEVRLRVEAGADLSWIRLGLDAACRRLTAGSSCLQIVSVVHVPDEGRLSCVVIASGRELVQRVFEIALLPSARVQEVEILLAFTREIDPG